MFKKVPSPREKRFQPLFSYTAEYGRPQGTFFHSLEGILTTSVHVINLILRDL